MSLRETACCALLAVSLAGAAAAANYRLSQGEAFSDIGFARFSPDGRWAVYTQDAETDEAYELWSVPVEGGVPARLSGLLISGQGVGSFEVSPDSARVVYVAPEDDPVYLEIYSSPIAGSPGGGIKLNETLAEFADVKGLEIAPDAARVVFGVIYASDSEPRELWSATLDGTDRDALVVLPDGREIWDWRISADAAYVLYRATSANGTIELRRVPITGGGSTLLSSDLPALREVLFFDASPDLSKVVYTANRDDILKYELFTVPYAGGGPVQVSDELAFNHSSNFPRFSPDGERIVYELHNYTNGVYELWSLDAAGGGSERLNGVLTTDGSVYQDPNGYRISPSSQRVVYLADQQTNEKQELYSVAIAGGGDVKLNGALIDDGDVDAHFQLTPDSQRVIYRADQEVDDRMEIYSVPLAGGPEMKLSQEPPPLGGSDVLDYFLSSDGSRVFYRFKSQPVVGSAIQRLWSVPVAGGERARIDGCDAATENVEVVVGPSPANSRQFLYTADQDAEAEFALYVGDVCILCNGFEGDWRWSSPAP